MIASLDSVESLCDFSYLEHDEAFQKMKKRGASSGFRGAVRHGARAFWTVRTSQPRSGFRMRAGWKAPFSGSWQSRASSMLGTSQAAIYAANECLNIHRVPEQIPVSEQDLNRIF
ncbi:MAG: hypothetical protein ACLR8P_22985 [Clostridium fessum]